MVLLEEPLVVLRVHRTELYHSIWRYELVDKGSIREPPSTRQYSLHDLVSGDTGFMSDTGSIPRHGSDVDSTASTDNGGDNRESMVLSTQFESDA
ncbi:hypothetical protein GW17_00000403 [Ensete ventricosum]|nr:hypothetical protein GW17_00000403 [Ensete ventricosum]